MEYYSAIKKNEIMPFETTWVDLEMVVVSAVSQTEKDKHHMMSLGHTGCDHSWLRLWECRQVEETQGRKKFGENSGQKGTERSTACSPEYHWFYTLQVHNHLLCFPDASIHGGLQLEDQESSIIFLCPESCLW